jgi:FlgD Ig-like domain
VSHSRAATALLLVLIAACTAAFLRTEQLKLRKSPIAHPHVRQAISPGCSDRGCNSQATITLSLRSPQRLSLAIVDAGGKVVRLLQPPESRPKGAIQLVWDGRDDGGQVVPDGRYRLRVTLGSDGRNVTIPDAIVVDTKPAGIEIGRITRGSRVILIPYTRGAGNVRAELDVLQGDRLVYAKRARFNPVRLRLSLLPPGHYRVEMVAVDAAGNRTPNPPSFSVTVP